MANAKVYKLSKGWRVFVLITMPPSVILVAVAAVLPFTEDFPVVLAIPISLICFGLALLICWGLYDMLISKWIINDKGIVAVRRDKTRKVGLKNFDSYRIDQNYLTLYSNKPSVRRMKISVYVNDFDHLRDWANTHFINRHVKDYQNEEKFIIDNEDFGHNKAERLLNLAKTKRGCRVLNIGGIVIGITTVFVPYHKDAQIVVCCTWPIISLIYMRLKKGIILLEFNQKGARPNLLISLFVPMFVVALIVINTIDVVDYENVWPWMASFASIPILLVAHKSLWPHGWQKEAFYTNIMLLLTLLPLWAYGSVLILNTTFANAEIQWFETVVLNTRETHSSKNGSSYYLETMPFGSVKDTIELEVSSGQYSQIQKGDTVDVYLKEGFFEIPYAGIGH